jgi:putative ABC transport system permease protein
MSASRPFSNLPVSLRMALRELRGGLGGFRIFLACLILGVAAIAGVGSLTRAINTGLQEEGQILLGGDVEVRILRRPATAEELAFFERSGEVSQGVRLRAMARAERSGERTLVEVKAVDGLYPLYGGLELAPAIGRRVAFANTGSDWGAAIPPNLADRLQAEVGDRLRVGDVSFEVRSILEREPDRSNEGIQWGPTVMIELAALSETHLILPGSMVFYHYKIQLPEGADIDGWLESLNQSFPEANWRVRTRSNSSPGVRNFVDRMGMFLVLVGLSALVVGGVGVGNAVRAYMDEKVETVATFKILGGTGGMIFSIYLSQVMILAVVGVVAGLGVGVFVPPLLAGFLSEQIPVAPRFEMFPEPIITAAVYGLLITLAFTIWPLGKARDLPAARLFRSLVAPERKLPRWPYIFMIALSGLIIGGLAIGLSDLKQLATGFVIGAALSFLILRFTGSVIQAIARRLPRPKNAVLRVALANLHRPGAATGAVVLSIGLGLTLFASIALVEGNLSARVRDQIPDLAPAFFMIDIQKNQVEGFRAVSAGLEGLNELRIVPSLRGTITEIDGVPSAEVNAAPEARWVISGDRNLTYSGTVPEGNSIVAGEWWPSDYSGPPLISFSAEEARGLGIRIGDKLKVNILGREIEATVANLRQLDWGTLSFNFVIVFAPGTLEAAPHTYMASLKIAPAEEQVAHRILTDAYPNVTAIRVKEILDTLNNILSQIGVAVRATAAVAILAGIFVLAGALAAGHRHRIYDAVVMKVLGAVRRDILKAFVYEYVGLGLITGVVALALGSFIGRFVVIEVMELEFVFLPLPMISTILLSIAVTVIFGLLGTWKALGARPNRILSLYE